MTADADDLSFILWPDAYWRSALARAEGNAARDPALAALYRAQFLETPLGLTRLLPDAVRARFPAADDADPDAALVDPDPELALSIVAVTRNDEHVERMRERTQAFINGVRCAAARARTRVELIIVEWNPPADRPPLAEAYAFPAEDPFVSIVIVTAPHEVHARYALSDRQALYQMIGKNVGVRRARGRFVLATNVDILMPEAVFAHFADPARAKGVLYRSNRWDVKLEILDLPDAGAMIDAAPSLTFRINRRGGVDDDGGSGAEVEITPAFTPGAREPGFPPLHTEACGDFQLLHRDDWLRLRGYAEIDAYSFHIDSLFELTCHYAGLDELLLGDAHPHFHIDHVPGTAQTSAAYKTRANAVLPYVSLESVFLLCLLMGEAGDQIRLNDAAWGLADVDLPATRVTRAAWETDAPAYRRVGAVETRATLRPEDLPRLPPAALQRHLDAATAQCVAFIDARRPGARIAVFGCGARGRRHAAAFARAGRPVSRFLDNRAGELDARVDGLQAASPDALSFSGERAEFIVVASMHAEAMCAQLQAMGAVEGEDFIVTF